MQNGGIDSSGVQNIIDIVFRFMNFIKQREFEFSVVVSYQFVKKNRNACQKILSVFVWTSTAMKECEITFSLCHVSDRSAYFRGIGTSKNDEAKMVRLSVPLICCAYKIAVSVCGICFSSPQFPSPHDCVVIVLRQIASNPVSELLTNDELREWDILCRQ